MAAVAFFDSDVVVAAAAVVAEARVLVADAPTWVAKERLAGVLRDDDDGNGDDAVEECCCS